MMDKDQISEINLQVLNTDAEGDADQGFAAGLKVAGSSGCWNLYYQFQTVEQDAVFSPFAGDDFILQTNHQSHVFGTHVKPWKP